MNNRQKLKKLKLQNEYMYKIITNSERMRQLYDDFNSPIRNVVHTTMHFQEFRCTRDIHDVLDFCPRNEAIEYCKADLEHIMLNQIKPMIHFTTYGDIVEASIFIGENGNEIGN